MSSMAKIVDGCRYADAWRRKREEAAWLRAQARVRQSAATERPGAWKLWVAVVCFWAAAAAAYGLALLLALA